MASNMKEIKTRINSINNSKQITNAMNIVSSTKFKKFQILALKTRDYEYALEKVLYNILSDVGYRNHILFNGKSNIRKIGLVVMSSDKGLCGSFNSNILKRMEKMIRNFKKEGKEVSIISIGKKASDYCKYRNINVDSEFIQLIPETMLEKSRIITQDLLDFYLNNEYDEVYLIYSKFISVISHDLIVEKILPFTKVNENIKDTTLKKHRKYIFEPDENNVLVDFLLLMLNNRLYQAMLENSASEHSARMRAMKSAVDNANDMISKLTLEYNRLRQSIITQELSEIVGGSKAIK